MDLSIKEMSMPIHTPIRGLRSFCFAAKYLSFKHAADKLFLTPSAVSHQIKDLEEQLGTSLFHRETRSISLTNEGNKFYKVIQPILHDLETAISDFSNAKISKNISICVPEFFANELLSSKLGVWAKMHPDINLQLKIASSSSPRPYNCDLSILLSKSPPQNGVSQELFAIRYAPSCSQDLYIELANKGYAALEDVPLLLHEARPWSWHQWADKVGVHDFSPKQIIQFDSMFSLARAAQQGMGIALVPLPVAKAWFKEESLVKLFPQELITTDKYYLVQHESGPANREVNELIDWLKRCFSDE